MIFAFAFGTMKKDWTWLVGAISASVFWELLGVYQNSKWRAQIGRPPFSQEELLIMVMVAACLCGIAYGIGRLCRYVYDRMRSAS